MKKSMTRRGALKAFLASGSIVALGGVGLRSYNQVDYSDPAYQLWQRDDSLGYTVAEYLVMVGTLAASPHNTQPWKFGLTDEAIHLYADHTRHLGKADPVRRMLAEGLGCAIENMAVMAPAMGYQLAVDTSICNDRFHKDGLVAKMQYQRVGQAGVDTLGDKKIKNKPEVQAIFNRETNRSRYSGIGKVSSQYFDSLLEMQSIPGIEVTWTNDRDQCQQIGQLCSTTVREFLSGDATNDAMKWFRRSREEWLADRDGISIFTNDAPLMIKHWMELFATKKDLVNKLSRQSEITLTDKSCEQAPLWGVIHSRTDSPHDWVQAGRALEKCYLAATQLGYAICPVSYPVESVVGRDALAKLVGLAAGRKPQALVRVGYAPEMERSVRRKLTSVLI